MTPETAGALDRLESVVSQIRELEEILEELPIVTQIKELEELREQLTWQIVDSCEHGTVQAIADRHGCSRQAVGQWINARKLGRVKRNAARKLDKRKAA